MPVDRRRRERWLAYAGGALFVALGLGALLLWAREGQAVYLTQIFTGIANCF